MSKKSYSKTRLKDATADELAYQQMQMDAAEYYFKIMDGVPASERASFASELFDLEKNISKKQEEIINSNGVATSEQRALIDEAYSAEIQTLNQDLLDFGRQAQEQSAAEFRGRGLDPGHNNSAGMQRSALIANEVQRQQATQAGALRGQSSMLKATFNKPTFDGILGSPSGSVSGSNGVDAAISAGGNFANAGISGLRSIRLGQPSITNVMSGSQQAHMLAGDLNQTANSITSSKSLKEAFADIDTSELLRKIQGLEIQRWRYKNEEGVEHIGPYAEDFHKAFQVGDSDKRIAIVDAIGIALAGIKELGDRLDRESALRVAA
ncbi:MAG TPA: tail fiber domain-containing protein [Anaerolineae bacterium]|nr:tail fiber domain-containing protein [Anaerolineae bacterium]